MAHITKDRELVAWGQGTGRAVYIGRNFRGWREAGWGKDIPDMLRNEDWNYAVFTTDKQHRTGANQAECLACHKPLDKVSYTFTLKQLAEAK